MRFLEKVIAILLVVSVFPWVTSASAVLKGDMNGDGKILVSDAKMVLLLASDCKNITKKQKSIADMDGDGVITTNDASAVLRLCADLNPTDFLGKVKQITPNQKHASSVKSRFCRVKSHCAETLPDTSTVNRSNPLYTPLLKGTFDYVTSGPVKDSSSGKEFYYLKSGRRVYKQDVAVFKGYNMPDNKIKLENLAACSDSSTSVYLKLDWRVPFNVTIKPQEYFTGYDSRPFNIKDGEFTGSYMDVVFYYTTEATGKPQIAQSDVVKSFKWLENADNQTTTLRIYFKDAGKFYGYTAYYDDNNYLVISIKESADSLNGKVIEIDPGHGGAQPGAGSGTGVYERDITYKIALQLKKLLESSGATVVFSRDDSSSVPEIEERRINTIKNNPDMLISIHLDAASSKSVSGSSAFYYKSYSGPLAKAISKNLPTAVKNGTGYAMNNRGYFFYPFCVTRVENCPSVLVECGFITNTGDFKIQNSAKGQKSIAKGIYNGILEYCEI